MVYLTRIEKFNAAHKLWVKDWSPEKNKDVFGKCANANWHGHNYKLVVTVKGDPDPVTGFVIDAKKLSKIINHVIIDKVDHMNLNLDVYFISETTMPTTENLVILFWNELEAALTSCTLHCVKLIETETIYAEYFGS